MIRIILLTMLHCLFSSSVEAESLRQVNIEVRLQHQKADEYKLAIKVINQGTTNLTLEENSLPWAKTMYFLLLAVRNDGTLLHPTLPVALPPGGPVQLKAGEALEGIVSLNERFPTLYREIIEREINIFWSAQLMLRDGTDLPRLGGWLIIPKVRQNTGTGNFSDGA